MTTKPSFKDSFNGVLEDSGWEMNKESSIPSRGITDYERTIKFDHELSPAELKDIRNWLAKNECPGWTGVFGGKLIELPGHVYEFSTTWDSSD